MKQNRTPTLMNICEWTPDHPRWSELQKVIAQEEQTAWVGFSADWHLSSHILAVERNDEILGFLRFTVQVIGAEDDLPDILPALADEGTYTEAKILAFGVRELYRAQGIGRALQEAAILAARDRGCWQIRSFSDRGYDANYRIKLSLGYAVHVINTERRQGVYFLLPLRPHQQLISPL
jgi:GNAT superfamily N-acetyltransferase